jgi:cyclophilin family peptidyl-prolyl cis-trans isomerase
VGTAKRERQKAGRQARLEQAKAAQSRRDRFKAVRNLAILMAAVVGLLFFLARGGDDTSTATTASTTSSTFVPGVFSYGTEPCPPADGSAAPTVDFTAAPQDCLTPGAAYTATFETSEGTIVVDLDTTATPGTTNNFVFLSRYHYYDGTKLFRTDTSIGIIQGGSPHTQDASDPGPGYALLDEGFDYQAIGGTGGPYSYAPGDLVMARTTSPNGAGAQFFFCVTDACATLDQQGVYVKFGHVRQGLDVLESILALNVDSGSLGGAPSRDVTVTGVTITETPGTGTTSTTAAAGDTTTSSAAGDTSTSTSSGAGDTTTSTP